MKKQLIPHFVIVLLLSFACGALGDPRFASMPGIAAKVGSTRITMERFEKAVAAARAELETKHTEDNIGGGTLEAGYMPSDASYLKAAILQQLIDSALVEEGAKREKISVTQSQINKRVAEAKAKFPTSAEFHRSIAEQGMSVDDFKKSIQRQLVEDSLKKIISANVLISDEEIRDFYDRNIEVFIQPKKMVIRHFVSDDERLAEEAMASLEAGEYAGEELSVAIGYLPQELEERALRMKPGEVSSIIRLDDGYHVIRVKEKVAGKETTLPEAKDNIRNFLQKEKGLDAFTNWIEAQRESYTIVVNEKLKNLLVPTREQDMKLPNELSPVFTKDLG